MNQMIKVFAAVLLWLTLTGTPGFAQEEFHNWVPSDSRALTAITDIAIMSTDICALVGNSVKIIDQYGELNAEWGSYGWGNGQFDFPQGITYGVSGTSNFTTNVIWVADTENDRIQEFDLDGTFRTTWTPPGGEDGDFFEPWGIATDSHSDIYVAEYGNDRIQKLTNYGVSIWKRGTYGTGAGDFDGPKGITIDSEDNVYVVDSGNHRIQKFSSTGGFLGQWGSEGSGLGEFSYPTDIVYKNGKLYVTDAGNNRIQSFYTNGDGETIFSEWGSEGSGDGEFYYVTGITTGESGIYVADYGNSRVSVFGTDGSYLKDYQTL